MTEDTYLCPGCDREVRVGVARCPHCHPRKKKAVAKRERKPWESPHGGTGLGPEGEGEDDFDYDDFVAREFGKGRGGRSRIRWYWWVTALVLLVGMILGTFGLLP